MRTRKICNLILLLGASVLLSQCHQHYGCTDPEAVNFDVSADIDDGSCYYNNNPHNNLSCVPDDQGNLVISNHTGVELYLYKDYSEEFYSDDAFVTCIPEDTSDFLVNIPNQDLQVCLLQVWKADDVSDQLNPDLSLVYRQWSVALSNSTEPDERANWLISGSDDYAGSGTLILNYPDIDIYGHPVIYQVDILLNSQSGSKLASLQPGIEGKKVSVDYGVQFLYFHYWYSDPNSTTGQITEIGWNEMPDVVINEYHNEATIDIPVMTSTVGKYGELTVYNENDFVINVYAGNSLIEDIAIVEGSTQGLSSIPPNSETTFLIPVANYNITNKDLSGKIIDQFNAVNIVQDEQVILHSGIGLRSITITNNTEEVLGLFNLQEEYLGLTIEAGKTSPAFMIPASLDTMMVIDFGRLKSRAFGYTSSVTINSLEDFARNKIEFDTTWLAVEGIYTSPVIIDNETTVMQATLINTEPVIFTFEYNVSSEAGYDVFNFLADGSDQMGEVSGETGWSLYSKSFEPGTHTLTWRYSKDQTRAVGRDNVQIRSIAIE